MHFIFERATSITRTRIALPSFTLFRSHSIKFVIVVYSMCMHVECRRALTQSWDPRRGIWLRRQRRLRKRRRQPRRRRSSGSAKARGHPDGVFASVRSSAARTGEGGRRPGSQQSGRTFHASGCCRMVRPACFWERRFNASAATDHRNGETGPWVKPTLPSMLICGVNCRPRPALADTAVASLPGYRFAKPGNADGLARMLVMPKLAVEYKPPSAASGFDLKPPTTEVRHAGSAGPVNQSCGPELGNANGEPRKLPGEAAGFHGQLERSRSPFRGVGLLTAGGSRGESSRGKGVRHRPLRVERAERREWLRLRMGRHGAGHQADQQADAADRNGPRKKFPGMAASVKRRIM